MRVGIKSLSFNLGDGKEFSCPVLSVSRLLGFTVFFTAFNKELVKNGLDVEDTIVVATSLIDEIVKKDNLASKQAESFMSFLRREGILKLDDFDREILFDEIMSKDENSENYYLIAPIVGRVLFFSSLLGLTVSNGKPIEEVFKLMEKIEFVFS